MMKTRLGLLFSILVGAFSSARSATLHLSQMHPERGLVAESVFYRLATAVCAGPFAVDEATLKSRISKDDPLGSETYLTLIKPGCSQMARSTSDLQTEIKRRIEKTKIDIKEKSILAHVTSPFLGPLFDVAEPMRTQSRIDGFVLFPSEVYLQNPARFLNVLKNLAGQDSFNPPQFLTRSLNSRDQELMMGVLSLLTHNHQTEFYFVSMVLANQGVDEAWNAYLNLNHLYEMERRFWQERPGLVCDEKYRKALSFDDESENQFSACFAKVTNGQTSVNIPIAKSYHFYGAWILSYRLKKQAIVPKVAIPYVVEAMAGAYKSQTNGLKNRTIVTDLYLHTSLLYLSYP